MKKIIDLFARDLVFGNLTYFLLTVVGLFVDCKCSMCSSINYSLAKLLWGSWVSGVCCLGAS